MCCGGGGWGVGWGCCGVVVGVDVEGVGGLETRKNVNQIMSKFRNPKDCFPGPWVA